jgi:hypothetical protein
VPLHLTQRHILSRFTALCDRAAVEFGAGDTTVHGQMITADETGRPVFLDLVRGR